MSTNIKIFLPFVLFKILLKRVQGVKDSRVQVLITPKFFSNFHYLTSISRSLPINEVA